METNNTNTKNQNKKKKKKNKNKNNNHNKLYYPVYYINLDRCNDRRKYMDEQLQKNSISYTRISAVDKKNIKNIKEGTVDGYNYVNNCIRINNNTCSGQLGCLFSHFKTYMQALKTNAEAILVFEDDLALDFINKWQITIKDIVDKAPKGWNTIQLHTLNSSFIQQLDNLNKDLYEKPYDNFDQHVYMFYGTGAYCISREGMTNILNKYYNEETNTFTLEGLYNVADGLLYSLPKSYIYTKPLFYTNDEVFGSNIYNTQNQHGSYSTKIIKRMYTSDKNNK